MPRPSPDLSQYRKLPPKVRERLEAMDEAEAREARRQAGANRQPTAEELVVRARALFAGESVPELPGATTDPDLSDDDQEHEHEDQEHEDDAPESEDEEAWEHVADRFRQRLTGGLDPYQTSNPHEAWNDPRALARVRAQRRGLA